MAQFEPSIEVENAKCFWCQELLDKPGSTPIAIATTVGIVRINNRLGESAPMIFCSSDCLVFDCNLRYTQRLREGRLGKLLDQHIRTGIPERWKHNMPELVSSSNGDVKPEHVPG